MYSRIFQKSFDNIFQYQISNLNNAGTSLLSQI